jgi:hypothetical protein
MHPRRCSSGKGKAPEQTRVKTAQCIKKISGYSPSAAPEEAENIVVHHLPRSY